MGIRKNPCPYHERRIGEKNGIGREESPGLTVFPKVAGPESHKSGKAGAQLFRSRGKGGSNVLRQKYRIGAERKMHLSRMQVMARPLGEEDPPHGPDLRRNGLPETGRCRRTRQSERESGFPLRRSPVQKLQ